MDLCASDPHAASTSLVATGLDQTVADQFVARYGKEIKRLYLDLRHARESALLAMRQQLESELVDHGGSGVAMWRDDIELLTDELVPPYTAASVVLDPSGVQFGDVAQLHLTVNQQVIQQVTGTVIQNVEGTASLSGEARQLMALIDRYGEAEHGRLSSAVFELEDTDLPTRDRLSAKQRLKGFLFQLGGQVGDAVLQALLTYVEQRFGV